MGKEQKDRIVVGVDHGAGPGHQAVIMVVKHPHQGQQVMSVRPLVPERLADFLRNAPLVKR